MRLITGAAGSGKTTFVLDRLRAALRSGDRCVRLLVPTATLAQHLQNLLAREGFAFPGRLIQTLAGFVDEWAGDAVQVPEAVLHLIVEECVRRVARPEFAAVAGLPGFSASLTRAIEEFSSAGCDSAHLAGHLPDTPLGEAFLAVYRDVDRELARRKLALRATRLGRAANRIAEVGLGGVSTVWLDGFHALPGPELSVVRAIAAQADLSITLTDSAATHYTRGRLLDIGCEDMRLPSRRTNPATVLVQAPSLEREVDDIALRILEQNRAFREIGIIVRAASVYVPLLRAALERFGIPARFYFDGELDQHPVTRYLCGAVEAMLGGWEHEATLRVLRLDARSADFGVMDRFAFAVAEQLPGSGLGALHALLQPAEGVAASPAATRLARLLDQLGELDEWRVFTLDPADWARRFRTLRNLFHAGRPESGADHALALLWRGQAEVLDRFDEALDEAALALAGSRAIGIEAFWRAVKAVLRLKPLRLTDNRRNVVHVLSAHEARQWELPVVFVCGLVERQFPQIDRQDPFFPEAARVRLKEAGIRIRTAADFEVDERALFDSALTRATSLVTLSYPEFDARGERNLPSLFLEDLTVARGESRAVRPHPRSAPASPRRVAIVSPPLLTHLSRVTGAFGPTSIEPYLQCAFQYFGGRTLRLKTAPPRPEDRLNFMLQGSIVHGVLQEWWVPGGPIEPVLDRVFTALTEENNLPAGYRTARIRDSLLKDLEAFARDTRWPRDRFESRTEEKFNFQLDDTVEIRGKIDRIDIDRDGRAYIIDYKYSGAQGTKNKLTNDNLLQPGLYALGAERTLGLEVAGMYYIGLRGSVVYVGWEAGDAPVKGEAVPADWTQRARTRTLEAVAEIRRGRIQPAPSDPDHCRFCDFLDVCRVECGAAVEITEGA